MPNKAPQVGQPKWPDQQPRAVRLTAHQRGYDSAYLKMRKMVLNNYPLCQVQGRGCEGWSVECHHNRYGVGLGLNDFQAVCANCHRLLEREK